jgi:hypothetical protein
VQKLNHELPKSNTITLFSKFPIVISSAKLFLERKKWSFCDTYRELSCHRVEAHMHRMLEIRWIWNVWFGVIVRLFGFDFILQGFLFAIRIVGLWVEKERGEKSINRKFNDIFPCNSPLGRGFRSGGPSNLSLPPRLLVSLTGGAGGLSSSLDIVLCFNFVNYFVCFSAHSKVSPAVYFYVNPGVFIHRDLRLSRLIVQYSAAWWWKYGRCWYRREVSDAARYILF